MGSKVKLVLSGLILAVLISSCSMLLGTSMEVRISNFKNALNNYDGSNIEGLMLNFSSNTENLSAINTADYWNNSIFSIDHKPFTFDLSFSNSSATGKISYNSGGSTISKNIYFEFYNDGTDFIGEDWKIRQIWLDTKDTAGEQIKVLSY